MNACGARNTLGEPCRAAPLRDGQLCRMHSPEHAADVAEARRLGGLRRRREVTLAGAFDLDGLDSAGDVLRLLEIAAFDAVGLDNTVARARTLAQIAHVAVRVLEAGAFEMRLGALEEAMRPRLRTLEADGQRSRGRRRGRGGDRP